MIPAGLVDISPAGEPPPTIQRAFQRRSAECPDAAALICGGVSLSYGELDGRSNQFARLLRRHGIVDGATVATLLDRSIETIVALLGILKAGAAFIPLDPRAAAGHLDQVLTDSKPRLLLTQQGAAPAFAAAGPALDLGHAADAMAREPMTPLDVEDRPASLAYIMYTSGSTGRPKGVMIPHRAVTGLVIDNPFASFGPETFLSLAPLTFDASTFEIWGALLNGARLAIMPNPAPSLAEIGDAVAAHGVTTLWLTAGLFHLMVDERIEALRPLRQLLAGGDVLSRPHVDRVLRELPGCRLINGYGPTENTTFTCCFTVTPEGLGAGSVPIGAPIARTEAHILDEELQPVPDGALGELYVGGEGLADGYLNLPELTARSFIRHPFDAQPGARLYRTGDLVRRRADGNLEFAGRADRQVKVNGHRIELDAVELALRELPGVADAAALARSQGAAGTRIDAYLVLVDRSPAAEAALRGRMRETLPAPMLPASLVVLEQFPLTPNGKVDRAALSRIAPPTASVADRAPPAGATEGALAAIWSACLNRPVTDVDANFFDLGGTSLELMRVHAEITRRFDAPVGVLQLFESPTIRSLSRRLRGEAAPDRPAPAATRSTADILPGDAIAIIGMSGRFPGAGSVEAFWNNLVEGRESISRFTDAELEDSFPPDIRQAPNFVRARSILDNIEQFDAGFFGMRARDAALTDPQHRVFLECAWEALENAGYDPAQYGGAVGVFAGCSMNSYFMNNVCADRSAVTDFTSAYQVGEYPTLLGSSMDFLATRVSYKLDLRGPSMTVQTACSTSLVAVAQACQALLLRQADMALAGGVSITLPQRRGYLHDEGGMVSPDGHCRTFDAKAGGTVFGSGAGVVLLKRLGDALADGDPIHAVIRGSAVNNDGAGKIGFTAPSIEGQVDVVRAAHAAAGVAPETIGYVECHGTATPLGDPIEVAALVRAFGPARDGAGCVLGSVKPNVGHLDVAAGVTGLIKAALCLSRERIPPTLHFTTLNPRIDLAGSPFRVSAEPVAWPRGPSPRRAGVSALGVGGTNVHVVLEEAPLPAARGPADARQCLTVSARSAAALAQCRADLARHIEASPQLGLADAAYTLQAGRRSFDHRFAAVCRDRSSAIAALRDTGAPVRLAAAAVPVVFMFPGQGSQFPGMARGLYQDDPGFRRHLDRCADLLAAGLGEDLRELLFTGQGSPGRLRSTEIAQPAIFSVGYALAATLMDRGIQPAGMIGHSVGEFVAACIAGVFSLEDALRIVVARGRLMRSLPAGGMMAVRLSEQELLPLLGPGLSVAAVNGPALCVAAGPEAPLAGLAAALDGRGVGCRALRTSHAFHSAMMDPILERLAEIVRGVPLHAPTLPYVSGVTGAWITAEQATSAEYWARHCREPVRFADGLATLMADAKPALLELGPGQALTAMARQGAARGSSLPVLQVLSGEPGPDEPDEASDSDRLLDAVGQLWAAGADVDWSAWRGTDRRRVALPTYPFERARHWIDAPARGIDAPAREQSAAEPTATNAGATVMHFPSETPIAAETAANPLPAKIASAIFAILGDLSGEDMSKADAGTTFLELGFDSLFLSQVAQQVQRQFRVKVTFRRLLSTEKTVTRLAEFIMAGLPAEVAAELHPAPPARVSLPIVPPPAAAAVTQPASDLPATGADAPMVQAIMRDQLAAMSDLVGRQLAALQSLGGSAEAPRPVALPAPAAPPPAPTTDTIRLEAFRPARRTASNELGPEQRRHVAELVAQYTARTPGSKHLTQQHRAAMADPRAAAGFRAEWKEMVYPISTVRSAGARLWDVDGNEYIDILNGFGQTAFGHAPSYVTEAVTAQLAQGFEIGPQTPLAGEVAELVREMTGNERVAFCNTGSEAVMAAMRVARAVTGRDRVVFFSGAYHGQFDEVLVKATRRGGEPGATPVASGIPLQSAGSVTVLDYASPDAVAWIRANAGQLAAVVVEPVQSRRPGLQPREFLAELRDITLGSGTALVFDEVVTGFRAHPGGMQAVFGIRADLATYGKVIGGGLPIGLLAGRASFMDALDGGMWRYGDDSLPEADVTFFAGTFVRHPLALAAARAVLLHMKQHGPALQEGLTQRTTELVAALNGVFASRGMTTRINGFASFFYCSFDAEEPNAGLLYYHLRLRGIHIQEGFPCFLTTAHGQAELDRVVAAFADSIDAMQAAGFFKPSLPVEAAPARPLAPPAAALAEPALTPSQMEVWLAGQTSDAASCAFNESVSLRLQGALDVAVLEAALGDVVARHDALRLRFTPIGDRVRSVAPEPMRLTVIQLPDEAAVASFIERDAKTPFDLVRGPVVRPALLRLSGQTHVLLFTAHHIVCDGWSMNIVIEELSACYAARRAGRPAALPPAISFIAYAAAREADPAAGERDRLYWVNQFSGALPALQLPHDRPAAAVRSFHGGTETALIEPGLLQSLKHAGAAQGCTLFVTLLAAFATLVGRLSGQSDVVIGVPTAGQSLLDEQTLVGHCVNMLPLRARWDDATSLAGLLDSLGQTVLDAYEHQDCTLGTIVRSLNLVRGLGATPLTSVQFNLERLSTDLAMPELAAAVVPNPKRFVQFELFLNVIESSDGLRLDCDYDSGLFDAATVQRWLGHYRQVLQGFTADAGVQVSRVALLSPDERGRLLALDNEAADAADSATIHALFEREAARRPDAVAVWFGDAATTYRELDGRANQIANHLRRRIGTSAALVGIAVERSVDMLAALLATLKAGCAYVPLDPHHPAARQLRILGDAGVSAVICDDNWIGLSAASDWQAIRLGADGTAIAAEPATIAAEPGVGGDSLAYVIYTSGSTGAPKGVEITHGAVVNFLQSMRSVPGLGEDDVLCAVTTVAFDIAVLELFLPLSVGAAVAIAAPAETADGTALLARMRKAGVTVMQATPATWRLLLEAGFESRAGLKMLCGGEKWPRELADQLLSAGGELWNLYGPTETTVWSSVARVLPGTAPITIGGPIANTRLYVLDEHDQPAPIGVSGQLHIAGAGLARGYRNDPARTADKFTADPFAADGAGRMFRTGDAAKRLPDGGIALLGRLDLQIKLRGFRIEIEEIEAALTTHAGLAAAAVALREDGPDTPRLVGYYVEPEGVSRSAAQLREVLRQTLPDYMIPSAWVPLMALPVSLNGKLDRGALPEPYQTTDAPRRASRPPRTPVETVLCAIWQEVLGVGEVGLDDDIFDLGVDSIQLFQITARVNRENLAMAAKQLFEHRTVGALAAVLTAGQPTPAGLPLLKNAASLRLRQGPGSVATRTVTPR